MHHRGGNIEASSIVVVAIIIDWDDDAAARIVFVAGSIFLEKLFEVENTWCPGRATILADK